MRIGTWNLNHAAVRKNDAERMRLLHEADADVWVLTETNDRVALEGYMPVHSAPRPDAAEGGRWVTIWSRLPVRRGVKVADPNRCVAAVIDARDREILVFGVVVPWHADVGEPPRHPRPRSWEEQYRVLPALGVEWRQLQATWPNAALCVAGDLNLSLGGPRYYGTARGRALLQEALQACRLECATRFERVPEGALTYPAIDHVLTPSGVAAKVVLTWEGRTPAGVKLSDHSGLVVEVF
jgi:hypothetical protein